MDKIKVVLKNWIIAPIIFFIYFILYSILENFIGNKEPWD